MTVPEAENSASAPECSPAAEVAVAPRRTVAVLPLASSIWEATVRFQISS